MLITLRLVKRNRGSQKRKQLFQTEINETVYPFFFLKKNLTLNYLISFENRIHGEGTNITLLLQPWSETSNMISNAELLP